MTIEQMKEAYAQEKEKLSKLSWPQKIGYILGYYKFPIIITLSVIILAVCLITSFLTKKEDLLAVMFINSSVNQEGYDLLSDGFLEELEGDPKEEIVRVHQNTIIDYSGNDRSEMNNNEFMKIIAMLSNHAIDVFITDASAVESYGPEDGLADLSVFLPNELYTQLEEQMIATTSVETGNTYPVAIDITDTAFAKHYEMSADPCYLSFPATSDRKVQALDFLEYFLALE